MSLAPFIMKLIFYLPSYQNQAKNVANINYIATRPGVDRGELEPEKDEEIHTRYMAERPGSHGLFSQDGPEDLDAVKDELKNHDGVVWRGVVSLREDEAVRINHLTRQQWEEALQKSFPEIAAKLQIPESNFRWAAAYHAEAGHPHCHFLFWENEPERNKGSLSPGETRDLKKVFVKNIYAQERERLLIEKTYYREEIRNGARDILGLRQELDRETAIVRTDLGDIPGIAPRITPEQERELGKKLQSLSEKLPGHGRIALKFMTPDVKNEVREAADWLLTQPAFKQEVDKYLEANTHITKAYTSQESQINQARENAYNDIKDRIAQDVLKAACQIQKQNTRLSKPEAETREWYKSTFRSIERERASVGCESRLKLPEFGSYKDGLEKLQQMATQIPEDFKGRAVIAYLPDELKQQVREVADWLLTQKDMEKALQDYLEAVQQQGGNSETVYDQIRDRIAENALSHALRLLDREIRDDIKMVLHQQRAIMAVERISDAGTDLVKDDIKEAKWTVLKMHEALCKLGADAEQTKSIVTRFAQQAGVEKKYLNWVLNRTYDGEKDIDFIGKLPWNRLRDNLGYREHELLNPWMGKMNKPSVEQTEQKQEQPTKPITPPEFHPEHMPAVLGVFNSIAAKPELSLNKEELQWTIWTSSWVLKELGVNAQTRLQILNDWVQRSGIEMSQARLADTIHRANLSHEEQEVTPRWLGRNNWERLMRNIGAENIPERPWQYPAQGFNFAGTVWKGLWQSLQRERSKSEYQARRMEAQRELEEKKRREGRER